jgi:curved DNA-binding protein
MAVPSRPMTDATPPDYYAALQVSPHADADTIERVFRHLAKRFHPDNGDSGDPDRFSQVVEAFRVLSDPEERTAYDLGYSEVQERRWKVFDQASANDGVRSDQRIRGSILTLLYTARRNDVEHPGLGILELERVLGVPEEVMKFHLWYLKERRLIQRLDNGHLAITVEGVAPAAPPGPHPARTPPRRARPRDRSRGAGRAPR